jgi:conjugative relaxase-like TrwC/TraI family protein
MLTIAKLSRWSINYYNDTARAAGAAATDATRAGGGLGEYYAENDTRTPVWLSAGDTHTVAKLVGLTDIQRAGGMADPDVVQHWLDDSQAPNGAHGRTFGTRSVHGYDLTFCAPKSVSLIRALRTDDVADKAVVDAHATAVAEAMEYLTAHAGYTRLHNSGTGEKDLLRLPGLAAIAYQHETSRCGDPHLHTHVIVPNRQARADGRLVSLDGTSLYHEAKAAGVLYQATLRRELHRSLGFEWLPVDPYTGMAEVAGIAPDSVTVWSQRSTQLRQWAAGNLTLAEGDTATPAQLAAAQKATRPTKSEQLSFAELRAGWRTDARGLRLDDTAFLQAQRRRRDTARQLIGQRLADAAGQIEKAAFTRADLVEVVGAALPVDTAQSPRQLVEAAVDAIAVPLTEHRQPHQREGHQRFTLDQILAEEAALLDLVDARDFRSVLWFKPGDTDGLSPEQQRAVNNIATSPWLVQPLSAPAGAGKTTSLRALATMARRRRPGRVIVLAPTGNAVDIAIREGAGDTGYTIAKALHDLDNRTLVLGHLDLVVVDEAAMIGTGDLRRLLTTTSANAKAVLVGDPHQLDPVKARGGMFAQLCTDLPWAQQLSEVWRMHDREERAASLALRDGSPAPVRGAVDWYRTHDRLHTGDPITMAADALDAYRRDTVEGKDALLVCDTREMTEALNQRIHDDTFGAREPSVTAARGHRIAIGDLIVSRRNDPTIGVFDNADINTPADPVRNGNRWRVYAIDAENNWVAARRLSDNARAAFGGDYLRRHITYGYAITVHSAQGVTADTAHAVLGENTTRAMLYVATTRGRAANTAHLYDRGAGEAEHSLSEGVHDAQRGSSREAARLARVIASHDSAARTAHNVAAQAANYSALPDSVRNILARRSHALSQRLTEYRRWSSGLRLSVDTSRTVDHRIDRDQGKGRGYGTAL